MNLSMQATALLVLVGLILWSLSSALGDHLPSAEGPVAGNGQAIPWPVHMLVWQGAVFGLAWLHNVLDIGSAEDAGGLGLGFGSLAVVVCRSVPRLRPRSVADMRWLYRQFGRVILTWAGSTLAFALGR